MQRKYKTQGLFGSIFYEVISRLKIQHWKELESVAEEDGPGTSETWSPTDGC